MVLQQCKDLDNIIGELLQAIDKNTIVMIMLDHGTMPVYKDVCINTFLKKIGLLQLHTKSYEEKIKYHDRDHKTLDKEINDRI